MAARRLQHIGVAVALIERRGRYLICQRRTGSHFAHHWEFPGGKRHPGESWMACVRRELQEELGVSVRVLGRGAPIRYRYAHRAVFLLPFRCVIRRGRPKPLAARVLRWVAAGRLPHYRFPPANARLIARLEPGALRVPARSGII